MTIDPRNEQELKALQNERARLARELDAFRTRLERLEASFATSKQQRRAEAAFEVAPPVDVELVDEVVVVDEPSAAPVEAARQPMPPRTVPIPSAASSFESSTERAFDWEAFIGGRALTWLGTFVLLIAVGFGVHWAWSTFDTPDWCQVLALHAVGAGLLGGAFALHRRGLGLVAQAVAGLAVFTLYAVALSTLHLYHFWSESTAFFEFLSITFLAIVLALRLNSWPVIVIGALGGYLAPVLTSSDAGSHVTLFLYLASLNLALLSCAVWRGWSFLKPLALAATVLMFLGWLVGGTPDVHRWSTQWLLTLHATIFLLAASLPSWLWRQPSTWADRVILPTNALGFLGATWLLFHDQPQQQLALVCWGLAALHFALFGLSYSRLSNADRIPRLQLALAGVFLTLAVPLQIDDASYWGVTWAVEGFVFTLVGIWFADRSMCATACLIFVLSTMRMLVWDYAWDIAESSQGGDLAQFLRIAAGGLLTMGAGGLYWLLPQGARLNLLPEITGRQGGATLLAGGNLLLLVAAACQWQGFPLHAIWLVDVVTIWTLGFYRPRAVVRWYGLALAVLLAGRVMVDSADWISSYPLFFNERFGSLFLLAATYLSFGLAYRGLDPRPDGGERGELFGESKLDMLLALMGNFLLVGALTLELRDWFAVTFGRQLTSTDAAWMAQMASYSVLWAVYAAVLVAVGLKMRYAIYRYLGLFGFVLIVGKVFLVDLRELELFPRVIAFAVLGLVLIGVSVLYQRLAASRQADGPG